MPSTRQVFIFRYLKRKKNLIITDKGKHRRKNVRETFGKAWWPKENPNNGLGGTRAGAEGKGHGSACHGKAGI